MEAILNAGGSVLVDGRIVVRVSDLPGPVEFVNTEADKKKSKEDLQAEIDRLTKQLSDVNKVQLESTNKIGEGFGDTPSKPEVTK